MSPVRSSLRPGALVGAGFALLVVVGALWFLNSSHFLITPDRAKPLEARVSVQGERPTGPGGIYYVDVFVRRASLLERLVAPMRPDGAELVPEHAIRQPGVDDRERRRQSLRQMEVSERVAAAVALRQLGYDVEAEPDGVTVEAVRPGVPAVGELQPTDVIVRAAGEAVRTPGDLRAVVERLDPGDSITLGVRRANRTSELTVRTVEDPSEDGRTVIGIAISQSADIELPIEVEIDLGDVGGPSAGLAFALDVVEELGRDVDRGYKVAATGELELDGTVAPVGAVAQKAIGARRAGIDVFLVPAGENADAARRSAGDLRVIPVESFQQALRALATLPQKG